VDVGTCCLDACTYPPVLEDIFLNGTRLTTVVRDGLPAGATAALRFTVSGGGAIRNQHLLAGRPEASAEGGCAPSRRRDPRARHKT
jgi:hypothetical protein